MNEDTTKSDGGDILEGLDISKGGGSGAEADIPKVGAPSVDGDEKGSGLDQLSDGGYSLASPQGTPQRYPFSVLFTASPLTVLLPVPNTQEVRTSNFELMILTEVFSQIFLLPSYHELVSLLVNSTHGKILQSRPSNHYRLASSTIIPHRQVSRIKRNKLVEIRTALCIVI